MKWNYLTAVVVVLLPHPVFSMGFCCPFPNRTLRQEVANCDIALIGTAGKVHEDKDGGSTTEFHVTSIVKSDIPLLLGDDKIVRLPRDLPKRGPWLVFIDAFKGQFDVYRGEPITPAALRYVKGLAALDAENREALLRYCFDYLEDTDEVISADAHAEFDQADGDVLARTARSFSRRKLAGWLSNPKTKINRLGLYGLLLGYCGSSRDAKLLHELAGKKEIQEKSSDVLSGLLNGYVLLQPDKGWASVRELIRDASRSFVTRYAGLRTIRFLDSKHPDVIPRQKLIAALAQLMEQPDIADLAIDMLRQWWNWELTDRIIVLYAHPSHAAPIIRRAIVRYALRCPQAKAKAFVAKLRTKEPQLVADMEESLKYEDEASNKM